MPATLTPPETDLSDTVEMTAEEVAAALAEAADWFDRCRLNLVGTTAAEAQANAEAATGDVNAEVPF